MTKMEPVASVILAGGQSRRMGRNKALLPVRPGGPAIISEVVRRLTEAALPPALLVTNTPEEYVFLEVPSAEDVIKGAGAMGGVLTALMLAPERRVLVVGCDMPELCPPLLLYMAALEYEEEILMPRWIDAGGRRRLEPLHAIYSVECAPYLEARIGRGETKLQAIVEDLSVRYLDEAEMRELDPGLVSFRNINTPEELAAFEGGMGVPGEN